MPYKSDAQRRWAHTAAGTKALGGAGKVAEWDSASKGMAMPMRVKHGDGKGPLTLKQAVAMRRRMKGK